MDKTSITLGLRIGRILAGQRRKTWYLYNGVPLPKLPDEWEVYPYAILSYQNGKDNPQTKYIFVNFSSEEYVAGGFNDILFKTDGSGRRYRFLIDGGTAWEFVTDFETENTQRAYTFWTSHDIFLSDGSVGLEASEPVPA